MDLFSLRNGNKATGFAKCVMREARVDVRPFFESIPGRRLGDGNVWIVGHKSLAMRGICHTDREAHADQRIEKCDFIFGQRQSAVISNDNLSGSLQRVVFAKDGISSGDGGLGNRDAVVHVAEIDHADDFSRLRPGRADEHVVIVRVSINDAVAERRQSWDDLRFVKIQEFLNEGAKGWSGDVSEVAANPGGAGQIPLQFAMRGGVGKIGECIIHFSKKVAETPEERWAVRANICQNSSREVGDQPNKAVRVITNFGLNKRFAVTRWADARKRQLRSTQS